MLLFRYFVMLTWEKNLGLGQPKNFLMCGQLEAHLGSLHGEVDFTIWKNSPIAK
jgi:hypothetical protein